MEELVGAADGELDTCGLEVDLEGTGSVRQVPHEEGTGVACASGLCCEIDQLGGPVIDK